MSRIIYTILFALSASSGLAFAGDLMVTPGTISFYSVPVGQTQSRSVNVYNFGSEDLPIRINDYCAGDFWIVTWCPWSLRPGQSCSIEARFSPSREGYQGCSLNVTSEAGDYESISISGQGVRSNWIQEPY